MIADIVHQHESTLDLLVDMLEAANALEACPDRDVVRTMTNETGWSDRDGRRIVIGSKSPGRSYVSSGHGNGTSSLVLDDRLLPWTGTDRRPALAELRAVLIAIGNGRMRADHDPIELLAHDLANHLAVDPPRPDPANSILLRSDAPSVMVQAPDFLPGCAGVVWKTIGREVADTRYAPNGALQMRLGRLPTEFLLTQTVRSMECLIRECRAPIPILDPVGIMRALSSSTLAPDERLVMTA